MRDSDATGQYTLTAGYLHNRFQYNPTTGDFIYKEANKYNTRIKKGTIAGTWDSHGHVQIKIKNKLYLAHRLAWLYTYGNFPKNQIDHINGIRNDNRIRNLRDVTPYENSMNKVSHRRKKLGV